MAYVVGVDSTSRNIKRLAGVARTFQVSKHRVEFHIDDANNVFTNDPSGLNFANDSEHFRPECAVICCASLVPGNAERLAWESAANKLN